MADIESIDNSAPVDFDPVSEKNEIIKIIGVGGAGSNAVNDMFNMGIDGVNYVVCNTDRQALDNSPVFRKIQLGSTLTHGLGAGNDPARGRESAKESLAEISKLLSDNTRMVFITAGMGGGTGTGAAPVIAQCAKEMGILTVGIVTIPYRSEGRPRLMQAIKGVEEMSQHVDSLLVVNSQRLIEMYGEMSMTTSLSKANNVLAVAAKGLAEMISKHRIINVDFADVQNAMRDSGSSIIGTGEGHGTDRAREAVENALNSPLLNDNDMSGARNVLVSITSGSGDNELHQNEQGFILDYLYEEAGGEKNTANTIIWGFGIDDDITDDTLKVTVIATGFSTNCFQNSNVRQKPQGVVKVPLSTLQREQPEVEQPAANDSEAKREPVELYKDPETAEYSRIIDTLYSPDAVHPATTPQDFDTAKLAPPTCVRLDQLTEEVLTNIENVPAYERRKV